MRDPFSIAGLSSTIESLSLADRLFSMSDTNKGLLNRLFQWKGRATSISKRLSQLNDPNSVVYRSLTWAKSFEDKIQASNGLIVVFAREDFTLTYHVTDIYSE
jgi:hypothetical protein